MASLARALWWLLLSGLAGGAVAPAAAAEPVAATDAWVRAPAPGQRVAGAYLELRGGPGVALVGAASAAAGRVELHSMTMDGGVMRMRPVERIELRGAEPVRLAPGGLHLMLMDLRQALRAGDRVPLALTLQRADGSRQVLAVEAEVRAAAPARHGH